MKMLINMATVNGWNINDLRDLEDSDLIKMLSGKYVPKDAHLIDDIIRQENDK
jgi:hypothetical protein